ncbi:hypothetical protein [Eggerthella sp.]|uniref:hypothetical protein n=1 Tax=Eggerthellaceae TaxID=1643826 RepID=UPI00284AEE93|nr:hypothetical protein [Eggerthella sp.]MDR3847674.1 hypothetical protein [Eggerthella sp.]
MDKKTKVILVAVAGMLAVGIALSVGSCALRSAIQGGPAAVEQVDPAGAEGAAGSEGEERMQVEEPGRASDPAELTAYERACIVSWASENGSTLQLSKGLITERDAEGAIHALTVRSVSEMDAGSQTLITVSGRDESTGEDATWTLIFDEAAAAPRISSDDFAAAPSYVQAADYGQVEVAGVDEGLLALVGGDKDRLCEALEEFADKEIPQASSLSFDGEAFVDFNVGSVSATFHANDPKSTIVTLTYRDGAFSASK